MGKLLQDKGAQGREGCEAHVACAADNDAGSGEEGRDSVPVTAITPTLCVVSLLCHGEKPVPSTTLWMQIIHQFSFSSPILG